MTYETEQIAAALKRAREGKGLSQRELAKRAGVPQSHISKIEGNGVDLRLSSLVSLAHALDLELELIPRKALPAVRSLTRLTAGSTSAEGAATAEPAASKPAYTLDDDEEEDGYA